VPATVAGVAVTAVGEVLARRDDVAPVLVRTGRGLEPASAFGWEHGR
jgi:hypothetical protein